MVAKPVAISLLLPVASTSQPNLFDRAMSVTPRTRDCRFSSARSSGRPSNEGRSMSRKAEWAGSMGITRKSMPRASARAVASSRDPSLEYRDGIDTPCTCSAPKASAAITATSEESIPPDIPITTSVKAFLPT